MTLSLHPLFLETLTCVALVLIGRALFGQWLGPRGCRALWIVLILRAIVPVSLPVPYHPFALFAPTPFATQTEVHRTDAMPERIMSHPVDESVRNAIPPSSPEFIVAGSNSETLRKPLNLESSQRSGRFQEMMFILWVSGAVTVLVVAVVRNRRIIAGATRHPVATPDWVQTLFLESRETLRLGAWPVLIVSPYVPTPCLVGAIRPRILVPESLLENTETDREREAIRYILLHELVHLKYGDIWLSWCWTFAVAVNWFNPLFWLLGRTIAFDCEATCDERVLALLRDENRRDYAASLLSILRSLAPPPLRFAGMSAIIETSSTLEKRLTAMKSYSKQTLFRRVTTICVPILLAGLAFTVYADPGKSISAKKARLMGYVENRFESDNHDMLMRKSLQWGDPVKNENGDFTITYKYLAAFLGKEPLEIEERFTFAPGGKFVKEERLSQKPAVLKRKATGETPDKKAVGASVGKIDPNLSQVATTEGWRLFYKEEFAKAEEQFREAVRYDPESAVTYQGLGWALLNQRKNAEAKENFEICLKLDPANAAALNGLGFIVAVEGDEEKAIEYWTKAVVNPEASAPAVQLANIYMKRGEYAKAVEFYRKAVKAEPFNEKLVKNLKTAIEAAKLLEE